MNVEEIGQVQGRGDVGAEIIEKVIEVALEAVEDIIQSTSISICGVEKAPMSDSGDIELGVSISNREVLQCEHQGEHTVNRSAS